MMTNDGMMMMMMITSTAAAPTTRTESMEHLHSIYIAGKPLDRKEQTKTGNGT
jgi:hypothetical protein